MNKAELIELIRNGEDSILEFKRDGVQNRDLAKVLVAFLNLEGGTVLIGVEDDGSISGTTRDRLEEWVSELCRTKIEPPIIPLLSWARGHRAGTERSCRSCHVWSGQALRAHSPEPQDLLHSCQQHLTGSEPRRT